MTELGELISDLTSGDNERADRAVFELPFYRKGAIDALKDSIASKDADNRWWATRALAGFQNADASELLTAMLDDPDIGVQYCAALSLSKRPNPAAVPKLITQPLQNKGGIDQRDARPEEYMQRLRKAILEDSGNLTSRPDHYALIVHSNPKSKLF